MAYLGHAWGQSEFTTAFDTIMVLVGVDHLIGLSSQGSVLDYEFMGGLLGLKLDLLGNYCELLFAFGLVVHFVFYIIEF